MQTAGSAKSEPNTQFGVNLTTPLQASDGVLYLLEVNYPCYFAEAQVVSGIDIAGAMIDHLLAKAASRKRPV